MNTQSHILIAVALFARPGQTRRNIAALAGGLVPDIVIYALWFWSKAAGIPENIVWSQLYWNDPWDTWIMISNSAPLYGAILMAGLVMARSAQSTPVAALSPAVDSKGAISRLSPIAVFALAAMVHLACDFPVHVADAHPHFWPFSTWRFHSPVSYWDPAHYGGWFSLFEMTLGIALAAIVFRRFSQIWVRVLMVLAVLAYIAVPAYFIFILGHHSL